MMNKASYFGLQPMDIALFDLSYNISVLVHAQKNDIVLLYKNEADKLSIEYHLFKYIIYNVIIVAV